MTSRVKPDSGLQSSLQSIIKNEKFKRMFVFGLRSVAEFCVPPNNNFVQNSLALIEQDAVPILCRTCITNREDVDAAALYVKIFWGISEAIKQQPEIQGSDEKSLKEKVMCENIGECLSIAIEASSKTTEYGLVELGFDAIMNYFRSGFPLDLEVRVMVDLFRLSAVSNLLLMKRVLGFMSRNCWLAVEGNIGK